MLDSLRAHAALSRAALRIGNGYIVADRAGAIIYERELIGFSAEIVTTARRMRAVLSRRSLLDAWKAALS